MYVRYKICYNHLEMRKNMSKVKAKIIINEEIIEKKGILIKNILKIKDNESNITFDYENLVLTRETSEYKIILDFKNEKIIYNLKNNSQKFYSDFIILSLTNHDKQVMINYRIEDEDFSLDIKYETI